MVLDKDASTLFLAIDLGTSGPKVALVSLTGTILDSERGETELNVLEGGGVEQSPENWWRVICDTTRRLMARQNGRADSVAKRLAGICCTGQWSGTVPVDRHGSPLMDAIIWMDSRGAEAIHSLTRGFPSLQGYGLKKLIRWNHLTGGIPTRSGKDTLAHILWFKEHCPELYRQTDKFLEPKDYLNLKLTGVAATTFDTAALLWLTDNRDPNNIHYSDELIAQVGIDRNKLPELVASTHQLGRLLPEAAEQLQLPNDLPVIAGSPDLQSACIGSGGFNDYDPHLYLGTSSWLTCHMPKKKTDIFRNMATLPSAIPGRYFLVNEQETSGACLNYLRETFFADVGQRDFYDIANEFAGSVTTRKNSVMFTPWLNGERSPIEDPVLRGGFHHLSLTAKKADIVRAVYEGVALNSRWLKESVECVTRRPIDQLACIGGGALSSVWCQMLANVMNCQINQIKQPLEATARGAAWIAAVGLGKMKFTDITNYIEISERFQPQAKQRKLYSQRFKLFKQIYRNNRKLHRLMAAD